MDATSGDVKWQKRFPDACYAGTTTTAGDLVFVGRNSGDLQAYDAHNGKKLWSFQTGAGANADATVFEWKGKEYIAFVSAGNSLMATPHGDSVWLFGLNGKLGPAPQLLGRPTPPLSLGIPSGFSATVQLTPSLESVDPSSEQVPAFIAGELEGPEPGDLIAIAVDRRVAATCRAFLDGGELSYGAVVSPHLFHPGRNDIGVYAVGPGGTLTPLGGN